jgi:hypothetical protein
VNVMLVGVAARVAGITPVPERAIANEVLDPLVVIDRLPVLVPDDVGAKATPNVMLWLGTSVSGRPSPVTLKPAPVAVA